MLLTTELPFQPRSGFFLFCFFASHTHYFILWSWIPSACLIPCKWPKRNQFPLTVKVGQGSTGLLLGTCEEFISSLIFSMSCAICWNGSVLLKMWLSTEARGTFLSNDSPLCKGVHWLESHVRSFRGSNQKGRWLSEAVRPCCRGFITPRGLADFGGQRPKSYCFFLDLQA